jgi:toxin ParE1/3/4
MKVRYTLRARGDLDAIYTDLDRRNATAAQSVKDLIERRISRLGMFPLMAPGTDELGILELSIVRYPYKVYYELKGDEEVWIIHIRDTRRKSWRGKGTVRFFWDCGEDHLPRIVVFGYSEQLPWRSQKLVAQSEPSRTCGDTGARFMIFVLLSKGTSLFRCPARPARLAPSASLHH